MLSSMAESVYLLVKSTFNIYNMQVFQYASGMSFSLSFLYPFPVKPEGSVHNCGALA